MSNNQIFNLGTVKELTNPIEELQVELNQLNDNSLKITQKIQNIEKNFPDEKFISQIASIGDSKRDNKKNWIISN
jgi:hypothetical protein